MPGLPELHMQITYSSRVADNQLLKKKMAKLNPNLYKLLSKSLCYIFMYNKYSPPHCTAKYIYVNQLMEGKLSVSWSQTIRWK